MSAPAGCKLVGRWRIVEADIWDRDYLDLCGSATIVIGADGRGEIAFGAMQATLDVEYAPTSIAFAWIGFDEMDEVSGDGNAELRDDASIEIQFEYSGDEALSKRSGRILQQPARQTSSAVPDTAPSCGIGKDRKARLSLSPLAECRDLRTFGLQPWLIPIRHCRGAAVRPGLWSFAEVWGKDPATGSLKVA